MMEVILAFIKALMSKLLSEEVNVSLSALARWLALRTSRLIIGSQRERYAEEWLADIEQCKTPLRKFLFALDLWRSALVIRNHVLYPGQALCDRMCVRAADVFVGGSALIISFPAAVLILLVIWICQGFRKPVTSHARLTADGRLLIVSELRVYFRLDHPRIPPWFRELVSALHMDILPGLCFLLTGRLSVVGRELQEYRTRGQHSSLEINDVIADWTSPINHLPEAELIRLARTPGLASGAEFADLVPHSGIISFRIYCAVIRRILKTNY
ncbi:hypothetical protein [Steroidobacter agaridevorans]|uniref:hypothetical protein n=1 Tax=Steroidobacter agaridevorans TaxID=2695856 RepID=UPI0013249DB0|nr:hypothetical protein [Steroidobacter agaridevorans]GFE91933.1 hypothetical protein GCM10011488_68870 [Steroidobacter agaridevorans]